MSPCSTTRIDLAAFGFICARTIDGAATRPARARPPWTALRRVIFFIGFSLIRGRFPAEWPFRRLLWRLLGHARRASATRSEDEAGLRLLVERPDRPVDARIRDLAVIPAQRPVGIDVDHLLGDRPERGHEMIRRLDDDELLRARVDAEIGEELEPERLGAVRDQHDLDLADADRGAVAERHLGRPEALPAIARKADDLHDRVDRLPGSRPDLAAEAERERGI